MIAVDAMGGDNAPGAVVQGAIAAARSGIPILLCGKKSAMEPYLPAGWQDLPITLEDCPDQIDMAEDPGRAIRTKPKSSLVRALSAVAQGTATAFFSAGNSGAVLVGSVLIIGRVRGVHRPAVGAFLPAEKGSFFCLDVGGNVDCKAQYLYQFGLMGHAYLKVTRSLERPRIALLSNGHEPHKGPIEIKKAYDLFAVSPLNFVGNIESRELGAGTIDVLVCDGFVGNVLLKAMQGTASTLFSWIKSHAQSSLFRSAAAWLNRGLFSSIRKKLDYGAVGGALMLGVNKPVILAHGRSDARAIENGIIFAHTVVQSRQVERFNDLLKDLMQDSNELPMAHQPKGDTPTQWL